MKIKDVCDVIPMDIPVAILSGDDDKIFYGFCYEIPSKYMEIECKNLIPLRGRIFGIRI